MPAKKKTVKKIAKNDSVGIEPLADRVVVRPLSVDELEEKTASGILLPTSADEKSNQGVVVAVGPGKVDDGVRIPVEMAVGDRILFKKKFDEEKITIKGNTYYLVSESDILATLTK